MPGGYFPPFQNPCGLPPSGKKCLNYAHKNPKAVSVAASINVTGGSLDTSGNQIISSGIPQLVPMRSASGSCGPGGAENIDDNTFPCGPFPFFYCDPDGLSNVRKPGNAFLAAGHVDLSGPCRIVGRQQAQFLRFWHGVYGFNTSLTTPGATNDILNSTKPVGFLYSFTPNKFLSLSVSIVCSYGGYDCGVRNYTDSGASYYDDDYLFGGNHTFQMTMTVDKNSGVRTLSGQSDRNTLTLTTTLGPDATKQTAAIETGNGCFATAPDRLLQPENPPVDYHDSDYWVQGIGATTPTPSGSFAAALVAHFCGAFEVDSSGSTTFAVSGLVFSETEFSFIITGTAAGPSAASLPTSVDPGDMASRPYSSGTATYTVHVKLGDGTTTGTPWTYADVYADITDHLECLWDTRAADGGYNNFAKHPCRMDSLTCVAPLYGRNEFPGPVSAWFIPDSTWGTIVDLVVVPSPNNGFSSDDLRTNPPGAMPWFDPQAYVWLYPWVSTSPVTATALSPVIYDGSIMDAVLPAGTGAGTVTDTSTAKNGVFDYRHLSYGDLGCGVTGYGQPTPLMDTGSGQALLSPNVARWTDDRLTGTLWPCEFVTVGQVPAGGGEVPGGLDGCVYVQRWREVQIRVPSENPCRPYGVDKTKINWASITTCPLPDPLPLMYPNCPGMTFSDVAGVGGRVRVLSVDGSGVATLETPQPYLSRDGYGVALGVPETVKVYDDSMTLLGTATAALGADDSHFGGFGAYDGAGTHPLAAWITPVHRNDGTTAWAYGDCDDFPKGHWVAEYYSSDFGNGGIAGPASSSLECAVPVECVPTMLQAHAGIPADNYRVSLAVVKQWDSSQFFQWSKSCDDGGTLITQHFDLATCTINEFVEAYSLDALGPGQIGYNSCVQNAENVTPWSIYLACPAKFPL